MSNRDLDWLVAQQPHAWHADPVARQRARLRLQEHIAQRPQPRGFRFPIRLRSMTFALAAATVGVAAVAIAVALSAGGDGQRATHPHVVSIASRPLAHAHSHAGPGRRSPLVRLADYVVGTTPAGDATLVRRTTTITGRAPVSVYDLYADSGDYYFSPDEDGLQQQVDSNHNQAGKLFAREVAAAKLAATGDVSTAAQNMADAAAPNHPISRTQSRINKVAMAKKLKALGQSGKATTAIEQSSLFDNWAWENSQDAIIAGAGDPQVRAGVLRILATLPGMTVTHGTADGQPTLVLTAGAPELGTGYTERLTINARTGVPIGFVGGSPGHPATTVQYQVSRVTLKNLPPAAGGAEPAVARRWRGRSHATASHPARRSRR